MMLQQSDQAPGQRQEEKRPQQGLMAAHGFLLIPGQCAGTSLREVFITWAKEEGWSGAIVAYCKKMSFTNPGRICLNSRNELADPLRQKWAVKGSKLLAGHFFWDFRHDVTSPYLMVTTLRNPLELFVSSQQFMHKEETKTLNESVVFVSRVMRTRLSWEDPTDIAFIRRFLDTETANNYDPEVVYTKEETQAMAQTSVDHLNTFYIVGVVEQYRGFIEVLKRSLDPIEDHPEVWEAAKSIKNNGSPVPSKTVLQYIDPDLVREFNASSLGVQWQVYNVALQLWDRRCREARNLRSNSVADFQAEMPLYERSGELVKFLVEYGQTEAVSSSTSGSSTPERIEHLIVKMYEYGIVEDEDVALTQAWLQDLLATGYVFHRDTGGTATQAAVGLGREGRQSPSFTMAANSSEDARAYVMLVIAVVSARPERRDAIRKSVPPVADGGKAAETLSNTLLLCTP
eukprot:g14141.t1